MLRRIEDEQNYGEEAELPRVQRLKNDIKSFENISSFRQL